MHDFVEFLLQDGIRLGLAVLLGGVIGLEREASDKPAGLRTNILICAGSTLMMILSIRVAHDYAVTVADPGRIAQGVITGIGFLGAGTILHSRGGVTGLTTAATTWALAGIGLAVGAGFYGLATAATLLILVVLWVMGKVAHVWENGKGAHCRIRVVTDEPVGNIERVRELLASEDLAVHGWNYRRLRDGHSVVVDCAVPRSEVARLVTRIATGPGVRGVKSL